MRALVVRERTECHFRFQKPESEATQGIMRKDVDADRIHAARVLCILPLSSIDVVCHFRFLL